MDWIETAKELPKRQEGVRYSQVPCIVNKRIDWERGENKGSSYNVQILVFNHEHECWDGEDGDDYDCDISQVSHWMPLPVSPVFSS